MPCLRTELKVYTETSFSTILSLYPYRVSRISLLIPPRWKDMSSEHLLDVNETPPEDSKPEGDFLLPQLSIKLKEDISYGSQESHGINWILHLGQQRLVNPCSNILWRGFHPRLVSLSLALGITLGLFPICGITILLGAMAAVVLQSNCHLPTLLVSNILATPFQLTVPFIRVGELVTRAEPSPIPPTGFWIALRGQEPHAMMNGMLHVIIGWCFFAPLSVTLLYILSFPVLHLSFRSRCPDQVLSNP
ncbi:hypothetical protein KP509_31G070300 [Ceratopteris richardii]|uniref:DUF2062 domain-containing protein n=1 Tax=Ceratopteris richardii TaxID=49495 RepID=A0A8T2QZT4_CERRI|nr:hypothetical protein KP509_31G070300 [Ceratopteris richardii]